MLHYRLLNCRASGLLEQSVGRGAADRVVPKVDVDWRRPGQRQRYAFETYA
jgi:hypothetical protein